MKLLLDTCVWGGVCRELRALGHDVIWTGEDEVDPGDQEILARAVRESRVLVTLDKDFGELAVVRGLPHCGIVRLVNLSARMQAAACKRLLEQFERELSDGGIITVEPGRIRIRPRSD